MNDEIIYIYEFDDFLKLAHNQNFKSLSKHYVLQNDIQLFTFPILGSNETPFTGVFDGNGFSITINSGQNLFNCVDENAQINNLTIKYTNNFGSICSINRGVINQCNIIYENKLTIESAEIGALVTHNYGTLNKCSVIFNQAVTFTGQLIGGLSAVNEGIVTSCVALAYGDTNFDSSVSGSLIGRNKGSLINSAALFVFNTRNLTNLCGISEGQESLSAGIYKNMDTENFNKSNEIVYDLIGKSNTTLKQLQIKNILQSSSDIEWLQNLVNMNFHLNIYNTHKCDSCKLTENRLYEENLNAILKSLVLNKAAPTLIQNILNQSLTQKNMTKFATKYKYIKHLNKNLSSVIGPDELVLYSMTNSFNLDNVPPTIRHIYVDAKNGMLHLNNQKVNFLNHTGKGIVFDNGFQNKNTFKVDGTKANFIVKSECDCIITIEYTSRNTAWIWVAVAIIVLILILIYYYEYSTNHTTTTSVTK
jgi:hypothetical protein